MSVMIFFGLLSLRTTRSGRAKVARGERLVMVSGNRG